MRWSGNMLFRKLIRTIGKYKAQFISMIVMIALGAGVFVGFNIEWYSLGKDGNAFFDQLNYADYRVYSETGFSEENVEAIRKIDGVENATRYLSVNTTVKGEEKSLALCVTENTGISDFLMLLSSFSSSTLCLLFYEKLLLHQPVLLILLFPSQ